MGACCSTEKLGGDRVVVKEEEEEEEEEDGGDTFEGDSGARVRLQGSSKFGSMFTKQGKKGINQDSMTMWETKDKDPVGIFSFPGDFRMHFIADDFNGKTGMVFCGVFDGHGPFGQKVSNYVRDNLPTKLSSEFKLSKFQDSELVENTDEKDIDDIHHSDNNNNDRDDSPISSWKASFIEAFEKTDKQLKQDSKREAFSSGTTAVAILKQGQHLVIANLGDSRAVLCTRNDNKQPIPVQLTVDLKPNNPNEAERINRCNGRVFAQEAEEDVYRLWLPHEDTPGLAMSRAFGDFCLKDYGLISTPEVTYREISSNDEFVVLATDGIWDVLSNKEVVQIVTSAKKRSKAAKVLVKRAVRTWRSKYPNSRIDDCAAICLYLNDKHCGSSKTFKEVKSHDETAESTDGDDGLEDCNSIDGVSIANTVVNVTRSPPPRGGGA